MIGPLAPRPRLGRVDVDVHAERDDLVIRRLGRIVGEAEGQRVATPVRAPVVTSSVNFFVVGLQT